MVIGWAATLLFGKSRAVLLARVSILPGFLLFLWNSRKIREAGTKDEEKELAKLRVSGGDNDSKF
jgi:hypothetical protein